MGKQCSVLDFSARWNQSKFYPRRNIKYQKQSENLNPTDPHAEHKTFNLGVVGFGFAWFCMFSGIGGTQYDMNMTIYTLPGRMMPVDCIVKQNGNEEECKTLAHEICTVQVGHHCQSRPPPRDKGAVHLAVSVMRSISCLASKQIADKVAEFQTIFSQQ